jgi:hypothetical protein
MKKLSLIMMLSLLTANAQAFPFPPTVLDIVSAVYRSSVSTSTEAKDPDVEFKKFTRKYAPPIEIEILLEKNKAYILREIAAYKRIGLQNHNHSIQEGGRKIFVKIGLGDFPDIETNHAKIINHSIERVINAARLRNCIEQKKLQRLMVPQKYIYKIDGMWVCVAEAVSPAPVDKPFTLEEVQEFATIAEETGYSDWHGGNVWRIDDGTIAIIDTEDRSFRWQRWEMTNTIACICASKFFHNRMQPAARTWLRETHNNGYLVSLVKNMSRHPLLPQTSRFDDADIDFEAVKDGHKRYNNRMQDS